MPTLVLLNGPPGSGKSTLAAALVADVPLALALDVDTVKHSLGRWEAGMPASGLLARRLALAMAGEQLAAGHDVVVSQYVARPAFVEELAALATSAGARWVEVVLRVSPEVLTGRLAARRERPSRPEHVVNGPATPPSDAAWLASSLDDLLRHRPGAVVVDADGSLEATLVAVRAVLSMSS